VAETNDATWAFVAQNASDQVAVLSNRRMTMKLVREIALPVGPAAGEALTPDGRYLLVAAGDGAAVVEVDRAESGRPGAVLGVLSAGAGGAVEVATSRDGRFAFVTLELGDQVAVFNLAAALADHFRGSHLVGTVTLGHAVAGIAVSPDGRWIYVTSELAAGPLTRAPQYGTLSVLDLRRAETDPRAAVIANVLAGCGPVRVVASANGRFVWVSARESNELLAFSANRLRTDPHHALLARIRVGEAPVGLALADHDRRIVVADSNRFLVPGARGELTVVAAPASPTRTPIVRGSIPTGQFPRDLATSPAATTLLVADFGSNHVESISTATLP
jgi:DNA-binding beta-propeller fold protein YncE